MTTHNCRNCLFFRREVESFEMPGIFWYGCRLHSQYSYLRSFPFKNTRCPDFTEIPDQLITPVEG